MPEPPAGERDERLAGVLAELAEAYRRGQCLDPAEVAGRHPELAADLRALWPAVVAAEEMARNALAPDREAPPTADAETPGLPWSFGDYKLLEELGRGGMGVVYKAHQKSLGRTVALKMLLRGRFASAADRSRFRAEAETAARLDHPHLVPVYESGEWEGRGYFTMK